MQNKSKILNIVIIILALALIVLLIVGKKKDKTADTTTSTDETTSENMTNDSAAQPETDAIVAPATDSWQATDGAMQEDGSSALTFNAPADYYISHPIVGDCHDVTSISARTTGGTSVPVAFIYKDGCVTNQDVLNSYTHREVKGGYVFQTNSTNGTVLDVFNQIVASASAQQ